MDKLNSVILTIPGISYTLGAIILSEIGNIDKFASPTKLLAFEGLDPSVKQSGNFNATIIKMSKRGSKLLRYAMLRASGLIIWNSETYNVYYNRKLSAEQCAGNVIKELEAGDIIVFHDSIKCAPNLFEALPVVLEEIKRRNLVCRRIDL